MNYYMRIVEMQLFLIFLLTLTCLYVIKIDINLTKFLKKLNYKEYENVKSILAKCLDDHSCNIEIQRYM